MNKEPEPQSKFLVVLIERVVQKAYVIVDAPNKEDAVAAAPLTDFVEAWRDPRAESISVLGVWNVDAEGPMDDKRVQTFLSERGCEF